MKKLTIKELAPYLPYGLNIMHGNVISHEGDYQSELTIYNINNVLNGGYGNFVSKPILRPLSDLTKEIEVNGEKFVPAIRLSRLVDNGHNHSISKIKTFNNGKHLMVFTGLVDDVENVSLKISDQGINIAIGERYVTGITVRKIDSLLFEWHFDVFGLIKQGLAIDINQPNTQKK